MMGGGNQAFLAAHPVGDYWWTSSDVDPNVEYGGVWEKVTDRFVYASGTYNVGATGGSETVTLTVSQIPKHTHTISILVQDSNYTGALNYGSYNGFHLSATQTSSVGSGSSHNNMPPYVVANCWHRTG